METMSLHEELEQAYASADSQSQEPEQVVATSENNQTTPAEVEEVITAPNSYKQEYKDSFNTLPHDWQKYLASREKEVEQGLSRARNEYNWVNNAFNARKDALTAQGYKNPQEYFETLVGIADALDKDPSGTIAQLQSIYAVNNNNASAVEQQLNSLAQSQAEMRNYIDAVRNERIVNEYKAFADAKDEAGNLKHPYLEDVKEEMKTLFGAKLAKNFEDAYNQAIWRVESVRNKILADKTKSELDIKTKESQKVKTASFNPTSKTETPEKELGLREQLERNYDLMGD